MWGDGGISRTQRRNVREFVATATSVSRNTNPNVKEGDKEASFLKRRTTPW